MITVALVLASVALAVSLVSVGLGVVNYRNHAATDHMLREHRRNHTGRPTHRPLAQRRPVPGPPTEQIGAQAPDNEGEGGDDGAAGGSPARYSRLVASAERGRDYEDEDPLATREHQAPDARFRRPPPPSPLPRPGSIGQRQ